MKVRRNLRRRGGRVATLIVVVAGAACSGSDGQSGLAPTSDGSVPQIVVTTPVLGEVVSEVVGDGAEVVVLIPSGADPHAWEPSAADIEAVHDADLLVVNGLGLEESLDDSIRERRDTGRLVFDGSSFVDVLDGDPHYWVDAHAMSEVVGALGRYLEQLSLNVSESVSIMQERLVNADAEIADLAGMLSDEERVLVTGHDSMAYFARRYGFTIVGAVIPNQSTLAEASAGDLAELKASIIAGGVGVIFTEMGAPDDVVSAVAGDAGVEVVEIDPITIAEGENYVEFILGLATEIVTSLASA